MSSFNRNTLSNYEEDEDVNSLIDGFQNLDIKIYDVFEYKLSKEQISNLEYYRWTLTFCEKYEDWKEYDGYLISSLGRVKTKDGRLSERIANGNGYILLKGERVHRLVATLFIPNDDPLKEQVDHINGIRHDNRVVNLRWVTSSENMNNLHRETFTNSSNRVIYQFDLNKNFIREWRSMADIVKFFGVQGIEKAVDKNRKYKGFLWYRKPEQLIEGEIFQDLYIPEINYVIKISNKGRYIRPNGSISNGKLNDEGYMVTGVKGKSFRVHRLVLMAFKPITNYENMVVDHIDGCKSNNVLENLEWVDIATNTQRHFQNNEHNIKHKTRPLIVTWIQDFEAFKNGVKSDINIEFEFLCCREAEEKTGFTRGQILRVLSGESKTGFLEDSRGKFTVRYRDEVKKVEKDVSKMLVKVNQFDLNGNYIRTFDSLLEAAKSIGKDNTTGIGSCCRNKISNSGGYIWRYADENQLKKSKTCKVVQLTLDGKYIAYFETGKDAERATNVVSSNILKTCKNQHKSAGGFNWMYYDDYMKMLNHNQTVQGNQATQIIQVNHGTQVNQTIHGNNGNNVNQGNIIKLSETSYLM